MKHFMIASALFAIVNMVPVAADGDSWRPVKMTITVPGKEEFIVFRFEYDKAGDISRVVELTNGTEISGYWVFEYSAGSYSIDMKNRDNGLRSRMKYAHDKKGKTLEHTDFNANNVMEGKERYYYENDLMSRVEVFKADMKLIETRRLEYKNKRLNRMEMNGPDGALKNYILFSYDANGNRSSMIDYGSDGSVIFRAMYEYEKGPLSEKAAQYLAY
jgi:hypothetical protein